MDPMNLGTFPVGLHSTVRMAPINLGTFAVRLLNSVHGPMNLGTFPVGLLNCAWTNESGHISCWAAQLFSWPQWIWAYFLLRCSTLYMDQWIWAHFLLGYSTVHGPMNLGTFPVGLHSTVLMAPMNLGTNFLLGCSTLYMDQWIWAHFLLGY